MIQYALNGLFCVYCSNYVVKMTKTKNEYLYILRKLFDKKTVLDMPQVCMALSTMSRTTGFRYLRELHHLTSYTHNGIYYTLPGIAQFDSNGFWYFGDIGFSVFTSKGKARFSTLISAIRACGLEFEFHPAH